MKNIYLNNLTGEVIIRRCRLFAYLYFKKMDKHFYNYKTTFKDVVLLEKNTKEVF